MLLTPSVSLQIIYIFADYLRLLLQTKLGKGYCSSLLGGCNIQVGLSLEGLISQFSQSLRFSKWFEEN